MPNIRILHVDDEAYIREVVDVSLCLDPEIKTRACASGADALVTAAQWSPSLVLLDVRMPLMDGLATLASLRENPRTAHISCMFLTARSQIGDGERDSSLGAQGVLSKRVDPITLAALVRRHLPSSAGRAF
jgi:CheY-like chemotaxis protein